MSVEVTEKWLGEIGGWAAMKVARQIVQSGSVENAVRRGDTCEGLVKSGRRNLKASLEFKSARDVTCRCACEEAGRGLVCPHALAVALATITGPAKPATAIVAKPQNPLATPRPQPLPEVRGRFIVTVDIDRWLTQPDRMQTVMLQKVAADEPAHAGLVRWLAARKLPMAAQPLSVTGADFGELLVATEGYEHLVNRTRGGSQNATETLIINDLKQLTLLVALESGESVHFQCKTARLAALNVAGAVWLRQGTRELIRVGEAPTAIRDLLQELAAKGAATRSLAWLVANRDVLAASLTLHEDASVADLKISPVNPQFEVQLEGSLRAVEADVLVIAGRLRYSVLTRTSASIDALYPVVDEAKKHCFYTRNKNWEDAFVGRLLDLGFALKADGKLQLQGEPAVLAFYASGMPRLQQVATVVLGERWRHATRDLQRVQPKVSLQDRGGPGADWLSLDVAYESTGGYRVPRNEVLRLIRSGNPSVRGRDGKLYVLDGGACEEFEEVLQDAQTRQSGGGGVQVPKAAAEMLSAFLGGSQPFGGVLADPRSDADLTAGLRDLVAILRPYQKEGARWLDRLQRSRLGGVLADEMGLGKTLQSLAMLRMVAATDTDLPSLVVCPTSLLQNWKAEAARFVPEVPCEISHGDNRKTRLKEFNGKGLLITTYGLISRDLDTYRGREFQTMILDEASYVRNPETDAAKALRQIRAHGKFALTGTPVENSVQDLWSIFEIVLPGYLGPRDDFRDRFQKPLASATDRKERQHVMERLRRRINPYLLRRTKREVATDLPAKIEKVVWCELTELQHDYYQRLLDEGRQEIRDARKRSGQGGARATMFTVLLRLRQVCNDLRLLGVQAPEGVKNWSDGEEPVCSGKLAAFLEFLSEARENGGKMLIFSQFTSMLKLLRGVFDSAGVGYSYLDGSSTDRARQVADFQQDESRRAFLISLKAGGYGLNLTAAEHVALIDPWWNPAVEAQAIDRAHRIGQSQPVTAYRFVTRGTVEEKILKLQAAKRETAELAVDDDALVMTGVTDGELESMLE